MFELDDYCVHELENVGVFEGRMDSHFLVDGFALLVSRLFGDSYEFAGCDPGVLYADGSKNAVGNEILENGSEIRFQDKKRSSTVVIPAYLPTYQRKPFPVVSSRIVSYVEKPPPPIWLTSSNPVRLSDLRFKKGKMLDLPTIVGYLGPAIWVYV